MIRDEQILVTGGAGFIGSHVVERLAEDNDVRVLDNFATGSAENVAFLPDEKIIDGSVTDAETVEQAVEGCDMVLHLAAMMGVRRTLENPLDVLSINIDGTRTVLDAAESADVDRLLLASTSEVYGDAIEPPYEEDEPTTPKTNYAVAKIADERFTRAYHEEYGLDYTIVRYFNVFGPRQDSSAYGYVVPKFVRQAVADEAITVHGEGQQTRDFTYIDDAVDATVRALGPEGENETFNIGTGIETSIDTLAQTVQSVVGRGTVEYEDHPRPYVVSRRCADVTRAKEKLGYEPTHTLEEGIRRLRDAIEGEGEESSVENGGG